MSFGLGAGYQVNDWLRLDVTGEYRGGSKFHALDQFNNGGTIQHERLHLSPRRNGCSSPTPISISAPGVHHAVHRRRHGFTNLTLSNFRDTNVIAGGGGWAKDETKTNFAWALHAGARL
jgi:hypothetical protein